MRILCFSDLHRDRDAAQKLVQMAADADIVIGAGDFANRRQGALDTISVLSEIQLPSILVPGNGESDIELKDACADWPSAQVLHGNGCTIDGMPFWGVGGGIPVTPFGDWSYDFDEEQAAAMLKSCPTRGVLVVHSPPINTVDHDSSGQIRGSEAIRAAVESNRPKLVVCGHIHSDWGKQVYLGESRVINAGPAGAIIEIDS